MRRGALAVIAGSVLHRFVYALVLRSPIPIDCLKLVTAIVAVSYTHLDVYKRQVIPTLLAAAQLAGASS